MRVTMNQQNRAGRIQRSARAASLSVRRQMEMLGEQIRWNIGERHSTDLYLEVKLASDVCLTVQFDLSAEQLH